VHENFDLGRLILQTEVNRRQEQEIMKLKKDLEMLTSEREMSEAALRKRHQDAVNELTQQLENINRNRTKYAAVDHCFYFPSLFKSNFYAPPQIDGALSDDAV